LLQAFSRIFVGARQLGSPPGAPAQPQHLKGIIVADKERITDRYLKSLRPAPAGKRIEVWDKTRPGFGIRVSDTVDADPARRGRAGRITFVLYARFAPGTSSVRRTIGTYGAISLEQARRTAGEWRSQIDKGIDPAVAERVARAKAASEAAARIQHAFSSVAETFIADKLAQERDGKDSERYMRNIFMVAWGDRPIGEITALDVLDIINRKKRHAPQMARALMVLIRRFFNWVCDQQIYGLDRSPCDRLSVSRIIGAVPKRNRRLNDVELFAFMRATGRMPYPTGPVYRLLLLTGLRLNECAQLSRPEVQGDMLVIPPERMKGKDATAVEHIVPLSQTALDIIDSLPRHNRGNFLFSVSAGKRPLSMTAPIKADLDRRMLMTLKAMARRRGEDYRAVTLPHWTNHDLRRTVRSGLSQLRVEFNVAEMILAHRQQGIVATYDVHGYVPERRETLEKWSAHIASIVNPKPAAPAKVIKLRRR
jgi:integrase